MNLFRAILLGFFAGAAVALDGTVEGGLPSGEIDRADVGSNTEQIACTCDWGDKFNPTGSCTVNQLDPGYPRHSCPTNAVNECRDTCAASPSVQHWLGLGSGTDPGPEYYIYNIEDLILKWCTGACSAMVNYDQCSSNRMCDWQTGCPNCQTIECVECPELTNDLAENFNPPLYGPCLDANGRHYDAIHNFLSVVAAASENAGQAVEACADWCAGFPPEGYVGFQAGDNGSGYVYCGCWYSDGSLPPEAASSASNPFGYRLSSNHGAGQVDPGRVSHINLGARFSLCYPVRNYQAPADGDSVLVEASAEPEAEGRVGGKRIDEDAGFMVMEPEPKLPAGVQPPKTETETEKAYEIAASDELEEARETISNLKKTNADLKKTVSELEEALEAARRAAAEAKGGQEQQEQAFPDAKKDPEESALNSVIDMMRVLKAAESTTEAE